MEYTNQEYGISVKVVHDTSSRGPFRADVTCAVTGRSLGGSEGHQNADLAMQGGKMHARKFYH